MRKLYVIWFLSLVMGLNGVLAQTAAQVNTRKIGSMPMRSGSPCIPVILVEFADKAMSESDAFAAFDRRLYYPADREQVENGAGTAYQYFNDQSNGVFTPQFIVIGPVKLSQNAAYYGADGVTRDTKMHVMMSEAIAKAYEEDIAVEWLDFDYNEDGICDGLYVIYAGEGQHAHPQETDLIWPSTYSFSEAGEECPVVGGLRFDGYSCCNELLNGKVDGIGTFCHEFCHQLGLPDFYRTDGVNTEEFAMGNWSLMDRGGYEMDGCRPVGLRALEKAYLGWLDPITLTEATTVQHIRSTDEEGMAFKVVNKRDANEYYMLEVIDDKGWNKSCRGKGLLISHIYLSDNLSWDANTVNNCMPFRVTIIPADNDKPKLMTGVNEDAYESSLYGDTYPTATGNNELTNTSVPAATVQVGGLSGSTMSKPITAITYDETTQTVSFDFMGGSEANIITSIDSPKSSFGPVEWYRLDGTRVSEPRYKGVLIRKTTDGKVEKVYR